MICTCSSVGKHSKSWLKDKLSTPFSAYGYTPRRGSGFDGGSVPLPRGFPLRWIRFASMDHSRGRRFAMRLAEPKESAALFRLFRPFLLSWPGRLVAGPPNREDKLPRRLRDIAGDVLFSLCRRSALTDFLKITCRGELSNVKRIRGWRRPPSRRRPGHLWIGTTAVHDHFVETLSSLPHWHARVCPKLVVGKLSSKLNHD